jgi:hypothetical protein
MPNILKTLILLSLMIPCGVLAEGVGEGYPAINGFFEGDKKGADFFEGRETSSSGMFNSTSSVPSFEGITNTVSVEMAPEVKQYEMEVRNEEAEDKEQNSQKHQEDSSVADTDLPDSVEELDSSIEMATRESSNDPRIQSALEASRQIREAIFGKKAVSKSEKSEKGVTAKAHKEESVRF